MDDFDPNLDEARRRYPDAETTLLVGIARRAETLAEETAARGIDECWGYFAVQPEYGCGWMWGDGSTTRDMWGLIVPDEDEEPTARVYDCDGETIALVRSSPDAENTYRREGETIVLVESFPGDESTHR